jgi:hypothetical protein
MRVIARRVITTMGIAAALGGGYFLFEMGSVIWGMITLSSSGSANRSGLASPAVMIVDWLFFLEAFVFGVLSAVLLAIAAWALEPRRRWREWRAASSTRARPVSTDL